MICVMQLAIVAAVMGINGCFLFLGDARKEEDVSEEAAKKLRAFLKEIK